MGITAAAIGAAAADAAASVGTALAAVGITTGTLVGGIVSLGLSFGLNAILGAISKPSTNSTAATDRTQQIRQAAAPHQIILGSCKVSGVLAYLYSPNNGRVEYSSAVKGGAPANYQPNELLYSVVVLAGKPKSGVTIHDV